ncbi:unnamed protein product [Discosporangium mesarthrocarpum]
MFRLLWAAVVLTCAHSFVPGIFTPVNVQQEGMNGLWGKGRQTGCNLSCTGSYIDVTVREAVEWTMGKDSAFTYVDIRSPEEREVLVSPRGSINIPAFEPVATEKEGDAEEGGLGGSDANGGGGGDDDDDDGRDKILREEDFEAMEWKLVPGFIEAMEKRFGKDAKLLVGCKTKRSALACQALADAGFKEVFNVESRIFLKTRQTQGWD